MTQVHPRLDKNLAAYMVAAGAAGASLLAVQSAEAKIVYTPANITIAPRTAVPLDLNHDGVNDFVLSRWQYDQVSHPVSDSQGCVEWSDFEEPDAWTGCRPAFRSPNRTQSIL
jgi:hypothetical protein